MLKVLADDTTNQPTASKANASPHAHEDGERRPEVVITAAPLIGARIPHKKLAPGLTQLPLDPFPLEAKPLLRSHPIVMLMGEIAALPPGSFRTPRLIIRPIAATDRADFCAVLASNRDHLAPIRIQREAESPEAAFERQLALSAEGDRNGKALRRVITLASTGAVIGGCNIINIDRGICWQADINWWLAKQATSQGYATEALAAMTNHAFADLPNGLALSRLTAAIGPENARSLSLAERVGFSYDSRTGTQRMEVGGEWLPHRMYELKPVITIQR